jgi:hypothetical protein
LAPALRVRYPATLGAKPGLVNSNYSGILTSCCPGRAIANTLNGTGSAGTAFTTSYLAANSGWRFTDPDSGNIFTLQCVSLGGGTFQWRAVSTQAGCTKAYLVSLLTCGHPFSLHCSTQLAGGSCVAAGTYAFTFSGT